MDHTENSTCPPNLCFFKTQISRLTIKYKGFGAYVKLMSRLNKGAGVSKFHGQLKKKQKPMEISALSSAGCNLVCKLGLVRKAIYSVNPSFI